MMVFGIEYVATYDMRDENASDELPVWVHFITCN